MTTPFHYPFTVKKDWVDYNGHMNDAEYVRAFSLATDAFMDFIGLDENGRREHSYTIFTLETHTCYLKEAHEGEPLAINSQLLDVDEKRIHQIFFMENENGDVIATYEQMLMGIDQNSGRPAPFPEPVERTIHAIYSEDENKEKPKQAGRTIGIRRKK
ncbi:thioesterase family protein [Halobacillus yeomjeoni]|uniref:Thioesterase family protein n=1 Tax=Halobacillus yeomjeoni TaxID=311194 RepID=A0A931HTT1_9BACI|nr:thioesterase family protein [Halobacillus yeomjeoni]MBH0229419.1 thioesterase family protein [Halobacillus yeomjeoni]